MRIRDLIEKRKPVKATAGYLPYIEIGDIDTTTKDYTPKDKGAVSGAVLAYKGDILVSTVRPTRGAITTVKEEVPAVSSAFAVIKPDEKRCIPRYLFYCLSSKPFLQYLGANSKGATYPTCSKDDVLNYEFNVAEVNGQRDIVNRLDSISSIITKRRHELAALDDLIKARFVEMFGDPVSNPKGWDIRPWEAVFDTRTGKLDSNASVEGGEYPFFTCAKEWLWIDKYAYDCEALLLSGNNAAGVYDVKHYKGKFNAYQRTYILQLKNKDWSYSLFKYQLEDRLQYLQSQSKGTNTRYLTMGILNSLSFIVPPKAMQDAFAAFITQVDKSKAIVQKALNEAQLLFDSLMQKYFG